MATFSDFLDILPTPTYKIGSAGQSDASGTAGPGFASVMISSEEPMLFSRLASGNTESDDNAYHKWIIDIAYNPLTCEEFHPVYTFLMQKMAKLEPFWVSLPQYDNQGILDKDMDAEAVRGAATLTINGTGVTPNMMFKELNAVGHTKAYLVTRVETNTNYFTPDGAPGASKERLHFTPPLRKTIPVSADLDFTDPLIQVKLIGGVNEYALDADGLFQYSIKLEEVLI
jgi:hypothetical protein